MKISLHAVFFVGLVCFADARAQDRFLDTSKGPLGPEWVVSPGSNPSMAGGTTVPYGSGAAPNLQEALIDLNAALERLGNANPAAKAEYLPRAMAGVKQAIADVKLAIDNVDGRPTPIASTLPALPSGVGNPISGLVVVPTTKPTMASPNMDAAMASLTKAQAELNRADGSNKGIFLPRAKADLVFAMDNANAAINLANGLPASQPKAAASPVPAAAMSSGSFSAAEIGGTLVVVVVLVALIVEQVWRARNRR